jgi:hypothetical protein
MAAIDYLVVKNGLRFFLNLSSIDQICFRVHNSLCRY